MRHEVDQLLLALWADPACKTSLVALAKDSASAKAVAADASGGVLVDYARAVLNDLMYLLKVGPFSHSSPQKKRTKPSGRSTGF